MPDACPTKIVFVAHNRCDSAVRRRALAFIKAGVQFTGFMYRRDGDHTESFSEWHNIDLGYVHHGHLLQRAARHFFALITMVRHRSEFERADIVYVRNLDLLILTWLALRVSRRQPRLVYECLDVHEVMTRSNWKGKLARWLERLMLKRIDSLVVSSPGFMRHYFIPRQGYEGQWVWLENKLFIDANQLPRPSVEDIKARTQGPMVLVWVGILRCQKTLSALIEVAQTMPEDLIIRFHGMVAENVISDFGRQVEGVSNIEFHGRYQWPEGLADAYAGANFVWSQELEWAGGNSDWLLPNRIYEASHQGVLSLAVTGTETARVVAERQLGYVLESSDPQYLRTFFYALDRDEVSQRQLDLLRRSADEFAMTKAETRELISQLLGEQGSGVAPDSSLTAKQREAA